MSKRTFFWSVILGMSLVVASCQTSKREKTDEKSIKEQVQVREAHEHESDLATAHYQCPMRCEGEKTYPEPGSCPKCKMDLKAVSPEPEIAPAEEEQAAE